MTVWVMVAAMETVHPPDTLAHPSVTTEKATKWTNFPTPLKPDVDEAEIPVVNMIRYKLLYTVLSDTELVR